MDIQRCCGKISVCHRFTINLLYNISLSELILCKEVITNIGKIRTLEDSIQEQTTKYGATTLVTQYIAQSRSILHYLLTIVKTTIGTCSQYTSYACLTLTKRARCSHKITVHLDGLWCQCLRQQLCHHWHMSRRTARAIEIDVKILKQRAVENTCLNKLCTWEYRNL